MLYFAGKFMPTSQVAVIIPVFNGANTLSRAIDSVLSQTFDGPCEIVVVNDGSTDTTADVLQRYRGQIRVLDQQNQGPAAARNAGVAQSDAEFLAFLDADDFFTPGKLARTVPHLASSQNAVMLFHDAIALSRDGHEIARSYVWPERAHAPSMDEMLRAWWPIVPSTVVMRRSTFAACSGFSEEFKVPGYEDPDLWIRAREHGEFIFLPERLTYYITNELRAERMEKYVNSCDLFFHRLRRRYGHRADYLIHSTERNYTNWLSYQGLLAMQQGNPVAARMYFMRILRRQPTHVKSALRFMRTFLPPPVARALSGRTAGAKRSSAPTDVSPVAARARERGGTL
jgi:glycosyltransferase involved in cell wall biosynthesis